MTDYASRTEELAMCSSVVVSAEWFQSPPPRAVQMLNTCWAIR